MVPLFPTSTLNHLIKTLVQQSRLTHARHLFDQHPASRNVLSWNLIIAGYVRNNYFHIAHQLFDEMPVKDIVSWNTLLSAFQKTHDYRSTYHSYLCLKTSGLRPNQYTFSIVATSFSPSFFRVLIPQLHAQVYSLGYHSSDFVGSALMRGYTKLGVHSSLCRAFSDVFDNSVGVWNALILGHMELGFTLEAQTDFDRMPEKNMVSWTTMIDGYLKNKHVKRARYVFDRMGEKNVISWTAMIAGYVRLGNYLNALQLFPLMMRSGTRANQHTFSSILAACTGQSELVMGELLHASILKHGVSEEIVVLTALVDMYAKCGNIETAYGIFKTMLVKNAATWNTMIGGFARHGLVRRAMKEFEEMVKSGIRPDETTFVHVLSGCAHGGKVEEGERMFLRMEKVYGISAKIEHYGCMVDLYGRAGLIDKAKSLIEGMRLEADGVVWGSFLGACTMHSNSELSSYASEEILKLEKDNASAYTQLSKIYGEKGDWTSVSGLRTRMNEHKMKKQKAGSWIS